MEKQAQFLLDPLYPWTWIRTTRLIKSERPELVVIQWWTTFWAPAFSMIGWFIRRSGIKITFIIHNVLPHEQRFWDRWLTKLALSNGQAFIVQTPREVRRLQQLLPKAKIFECTLPIYHFTSDERLSQSDARQRLNIPEMGTLFLFFGLVRPYKGLKYLLEALAILHKQGVQPKLLIAGEFWEERQMYSQMIEDYQISDQVIIDDRYVPNERVELLFTAADCLVAPYVSGTQSGAASIALGFGLPMIVTTQVSEGIKDEYRKYLQVVEPENAKALAQAMGEFIDQAEDKKSFHKPAQNDWGQLVQILLQSAK